MKVKTPLIAWHSKEPIFSLDFHPSGRLATGGADNDVKIWMLEEKSGKLEIEFLSNLKRHEKSVNAVRFSPNGELLASGGDDNIVILWKLDSVSKSQNKLNFGEDDEEGLSKETWTVVTMLRGHFNDIYDLSWSPDSSALLSASTDNNCIIWKLNTDKASSVTLKQNHYAQGVAWDPLGQYIASQSSDRTCRIYANKKTHKCLHVLKILLSENKQINENNSNVNQNRLFGDETINSFFRRLAWTPDGSFLLTPAGIHYKKQENSTLKAVGFTTYMFSRNDFTKPVAHYPVGTSGAPLVVRCNPILWKKQQPENKLFDLEYRMIWAVATNDSVLVYDTENTTPIALLENSHYAELTDLAWSWDGLRLIVSSKDGFCTLLQFQPKDFGDPYSPQK